jgi:hypothetical protein
MFGLVEKQIFVRIRDPSITTASKALDGIIVFP